MNKFLMCLLSVPMLLGLVAPNEVNVKNEIIPVGSTCEMDPSFAAWYDAAYPHVNKDDVTILMIGNTLGYDNEFNKIKSLKGLECFVNATIVAIEDLPNLESFTMPNDSNIKDIILKNLPKLNKVTLHNNDMVKTIGLIGLDALKELEVINASTLREISFIDTPHLKTVQINNSKSLDKLNLNQQPDLEQINLIETGMQRLDLNGFSKLETLNVTGSNQLERLTLMNLEQLKALDLSSSTQLEMVEMNNLPELETFVQPNTNCLDSLKLYRINKLTSMNLDKQSNMTLLYINESSLKRLDLPVFEATNMNVNFYNMSAEAIDFSKFKQVENFILNIGVTECKYIPESLRTAIDVFFDYGGVSFDGGINYIYPKNTTLLTYVKKTQGYEIDMPIDMELERMTWANQDFVVKDGKLWYQGDDFENAIKDLYYDYKIIDELSEESQANDVWIGDRTLSHRTQYLRVYPTFAEKSVDEVVKDERPSVVGETNNVEQGKGVSAPPTGDATNQGILLLLGLTALVFIAKTYKKYTA